MDDPLPFNRDIANMNPTAEGFKNSFGGHIEQEWEDVMPAEGVIVEAEPPDEGEMGRVTPFTSNGAEAAPANPLEEAQEIYERIVLAERMTVVDYWLFGEQLEAIREANPTITDYGRWKPFLREQEWDYERVKKARRIHNDYTLEQAESIKNVNRALGYVKEEEPPVIAKIPAEEIERRRRAAMLLEEQEERPEEEIAAEEEEEEWRENQRRQARFLREQREATETEEEPEEDEEIDDDAEDEPEVPAVPKITYKIKVKIEAEVEVEAENQELAESEVLDEWRHLLYQTDGVQVQIIKQRSYGDVDWRREGL